MARTSFKVSNEQVDIAVMAEQIKNIKDTVRSIDDKLEKDYVLRSEFAPVRSIVYGLVAIILTSVVGAVLTFLLKR